MVVTTASQDSGSLPPLAALQFEGGRVLIHPTATVEVGARIGADVTIGPYTIVYANVTIGPGTTIESHCVVGRTEPGYEPLPLLVGSDSILRSHTVLYGGSVIGDGLQTGHGALVREASTIGERCRIGTQADVEGNVSIGDYVTIHSFVFVAPDATIGSFAWLFPHVVLTNDPHPPSDVSEGVAIGDFAAVGAGAVILPGVRLGRDTLVAAGAVVTVDVLDGRVAGGVPAVDLGDASDIRLRSTDGAAYPWRRHFKRGYPEAVTRAWPSSPTTDQR